MFTNNFENEEVYMKKLKQIIFEPYPMIGQRVKRPEDKEIILDSKLGYTLWDDKTEYPSIFENVFNMHVVLEDFVFTVEVKGQNAILKDKRYRWNNADIRGILKMFCSPDDRRIILCSGIHDYMLEFKQDIYRKIKSKYTPEEYRRLTSDIFIYLCESQGFTKFKAKLMGNLVDCFQKHFQKKKWQLL